MRAETEDLGIWAEMKTKAHAAPRAYSLANLRGRTQRFTSGGHRLPSLYRKGEGDGNR